jgi:hypothetical protein
MGKIHTFTQLTAPGNTAAIPTAAYARHTLQYTVASIDTNVVVNWEGTLDGTNWFDLRDAGDKTILANGTSAFEYSKLAVAAIRFVFVSESGGTAATIDCKYMGDK